MVLRRAVVLACLAAACVAIGPHVAVAQSEAPAVVELRIDGVVDPFVADHVEGGIADAADAGAAAVLLTLDTPGGLDSSMRQITQAILNAEIPVIGYVSPQGARAASAGTFILLSTNIAAMAPATNVGAAQPVGLSGAVASEKAVNDATAPDRPTGCAAPTLVAGAMAAMFVDSSMNVPAEAALAPCGDT